MNGMTTIGNIRKRDLQVGAMWHPGSGRRALELTNQRYRFGKLQISFGFMGFPSPRHSGCNQHHVDDVSNPGERHYLGPVFPGEQFAGRHFIGMGLIGVGPAAIDGQLLARIRIEKLSAKWRIDWTKRCELADPNCG